LKIGIVGTGYVGLVTGTCFAEMGNTVICVDSDAGKIEGLRQGQLPIHEPGLEPLVLSNAREGRLRFSTSLAEAVAESHVHFIAVGTPPGDDGSADLQHVLAVARELGRLIDRDSIIVDKSTVPVGTADLVRTAIHAELDRRGVTVRAEVVSNPEFLKEGAAIHDFMSPERVIVGTDSEHAIEVMRTLYGPFTRSHERLIVMGVRDAEMTKYAANAMLATRISFMNEIATLCEKLGVDVENVRRGIGSDSRIGHAFIYPGCGYGGSCFPKDVKALIHMAETNGITPGILHAVETRNAAQKERLFEKIRDRFGASLANMSIGVWGLAFKAGTDDVREAPALVLIERLLAAGAKVKAFDPVAKDTAARAMPAEWLADGRVVLCEHQYDAIKGVDAMALVTDWKPFRHPDFEAMKTSMKQAVIFDGRNQYEPNQVRAEGFEYFGIGR
jgi:UDPglucose 6-dehydrogenase